MFGQLSLLKDYLSENKRIGKVGEKLLGEGYSYIFAIWVCATLKGMVVKLF